MNQGKNVGFNFFQVWCAHKSGDMINFIILECRVSSRLKWYKNYKNRLRLATVIVKNKMSRFFMVHCVVWNHIIYILTTLKEICMRSICRLLILFRNWVCSAHPLKIPRVQKSILSDVCKNEQSYTLAPEPWGTGGARAPPPLFQMAGHGGAPWKNV